VDDVACGVFCFARILYYCVKTRTKGGRGWVHLTLTSHHSRRLIDLPFPDKFLSSVFCLGLGGCVFMSVGRSSLCLFQ